MVSKKGNAILDVLMFMIVIFAFTIIGIFAYYISDNFNTEFQNDPDINIEAKTQLGELNTRYPSFLDGLIMFAIFGLWFGLVVASFKIDTHPIFFVATVIIAVFVILLGAMFANILEEVSDDPDIQTYADKIPVTDWLAQQYPYLAMIMIFSVIISLFAKRAIFS